MDPAQEMPLVGFAGGTEWCVDASGCDASKLRDLDLITSICDSVIKDLGLTVVGAPQRHAFPGPGGVTTLYLLSESHLACHTYPEYSFATFNLYCCRNRLPWDWQGQLCHRILARHVVVRQIERVIQSPRIQAPETMDDRMRKNRLERDRIGIDGRPMETQG